MGCLLWLYQFLVLFHLHFLATCLSSLTHTCPHDQSFALLQFKHSFFINSSASTEICDEYAGIASYPKTASWKEGTDCCSWEGVTCDSLTGHVIGLDLSCSWLYGTFPFNSSLFLLPHLKSLNLTLNDFNNSRISSQFGGFASLTHLNLSYSWFSGQVPSQISHLSRLISLDLSSSYYYYYYHGLRLRIETPTLKRIVHNLTEVRELFLDGIDMSSIAPGSLMNLSSSLTSLSLGDCQLRGNFPINFFYRQKLQLLRLNDNSDLRGYFPKSNWSGPLELLDVSSTLFSGELPDSIGNLESLKYLSLSNCNFTGSIPSSLNNLQQLTHLDLSYSNFSGRFPESIGYLESLNYLHLFNCNFIGQFPPSLKNLKQLTVLDLSYNYFTGPIPDIFGNLSKLAYLYLYENNFGGQLPSSVFNLSQLEELILSGNQLVGSIPYQVGRLPNLSYLYLSDNLLNGTIPSWLYTLSSLRALSLYNNQLTGQINEFLSRSLTGIELANNKLHGPLPISIFELVNLTSLSLSSNNLSGKVELDLFSKLKNLQFLDLSYNSLSLVSTNIHVNYTLPSLQQLSLTSCNIIEFPYFLQASTNLRYLDLSSNKIQGQIPKWMWDVGKDSLSYMIVSHNLLTGELSSLICKLRFLEILDLSHNNLTGIIPACFENLSESLWVLDMRKNKFHGILPVKFSEHCRLNHLNLNGNQLGGSVPRSMVNCRNLEVVDLGNNKINDTFPDWLGNLPALQVLVLRSNKFHSYVRGSRNNHSFSKLRIFDLSNNDFVGPLPIKYIKRFKAMINVSEGKSDQQYMSGTVAYGFSYDFSVSVTIKGFEYELVKILTIFTSIDLSKNMFEGEIPEIIGKLSSLKGLNLSHNSLTGNIPSSLGNISALESLDLSCNKLVGKIPEQLTSLTFLEVLNLSHNQLVGIIPQGNQLNTFRNDSYSENSGLCGLPLSKKCSNDEAPQPLPSVSHEDEDSGSGIDWKITMMGYGCGLVFGLSMGYIVFSTGKPQWFVRLVEGDRHKKVRRTSQRRQGRIN